MALMMVMSEGGTDEWQIVCISSTHGWIIIKFCNHGPESMYHNEYCNLLTFHFFTPTNHFPTTIWPNNIPVLCVCSSGDCFMSWDDFGDLSSAGSSRSAGRREDISRTETQSQIERTLRLFGPTALLRLHPAQGAKCYLISYFSDTLFYRSLNFKLKMYYQYLIVHF